MLGFEAIDFSWSVMSSDILTVFHLHVGGIFLIMTTNQLLQGCQTNISALFILKPLHDGFTHIAFKFVSNLTGYRHDWFQNDERVTIVVYTKSKEMKPEHVIVDLKGRELLLTVFIDDHTFTLHTGTGKETSVV